MHTSRIRCLILTTLIVVLTGCGGGSDSSSGAARARVGDPALVGTWSLTSENGVPVPPGMVTLTVTADTYTVANPNCNETGTYTITAPGILTGTVSAATGLDCDPAGSTFVYSYTVTSTTLTLIEQSTGETTVWTQGGGLGNGGGAQASYVGSYGGTGTMTFSAPGTAPASQPITIVIQINPDNTVVLDPGSGFEGWGTISGNVITASYPGSLANRPGVTCSGAVDVNATVTGPTFDGTIGPSTIVCNGIPITFSGAFTVAKTAKSPISRSTIIDQLRRTVLQVAGQ